MIYPAQMNVFGGGMSPQISYKYDRATTSWKKHYNIYDHLGTLAQTYKQSGFGATPTSMQTHKPFGGENWLNNNLTETESTLLNWVGKEKDNESKLGDHGVRKYEYETGRFLSIDPLWANYYGWTPYQYAGNDPVNKVDPYGKAWWTLHIKMDQEGRLLAGQPTAMVALLSPIDALEQIWIEVFQGWSIFYKEESHLDNMSNSELRPLLENGSYKNFTTHQGQDFYFHSNYIELMILNDYELGSIPAFNELIHNNILNNIMTSNYPSKSSSDIHSHDVIDGVNKEVKDFKNNGAFSAKDEKDHPYYKEAYRLGVIGTAYIYKYKFQVVAKKIPQPAEEVKEAKGAESTDGK